MNIEDEGQFENEDQCANSNYGNYKKLGLRIKALELAVELKLKGSSFTNNDLLKLACYKSLYDFLDDFLDDDIKVSIKRLRLDK